MTASHTMAIGELARKTGTPASALRYYEKERLLRPLERQSGRRRFGPDAVPRVKMIRFAREAGFSIAEMRLLLRGFDQEGLAKTWRTMAAKKISKLRLDADRIATMLAMLERALACGCADLPACVKAIEAHRKRQGLPRRG